MEFGIFMYGKIHQSKGYKGSMRVCSKEGRAVNARTEIFVE
jgi:hypothetical protein